MAGHSVTGFSPPAAGVVALSANESPWAPDSAVLRAIETRARTLHRYPDPSSARLRAVLADRFCVRAERVLIGHGASELLWAIALARLGDGAPFVFPAHSYYAYPALAGLTGADPVPVPLNSLSANDLPAMANAATGAALVCVCNPNNPTGGACPPEAIRRLLGELPSSVPVVFDEAFREFNRLADQAGENELLQSFPNTVILRTFSKAYRLAGARIGYAIFGSDELAAEVDAVRPTFPVSSLAEGAALAAFGDPAGLAIHVDAAISVREELRAGLSALGFEVAPSEGNFVWAVPPDGRADDELGRRLAGAGIQVAVGSELCGANGLRITAGTTAEAEQAIDALRRVLEGAGV
ncbi:MAG: histidinol-phosphate transaminase [Solirubrobacterales bacterium]